MFEPCFEPGLGSRLGRFGFAPSSRFRQGEFAPSSRPQPSPVRGRFAFRTWPVRVEFGFAPSSGSRRVRVRVEFAPPAQPGSGSVRVSGMAGSRPGSGSRRVRVRAEFGFAPRRVRAEFAPPAQPGSAWPSLVQPSPAQPSPSPSPSPAGFAMCRVRVRVEFAAWGRAGSGSRFGFAKCRVRVRFGFAICRVRVRESSGSRQGEFASSSRFAGTRFASRFDQPRPGTGRVLCSRGRGVDGGVRIPRLSLLLGRRRGSATSAGGKLHRIT